MAVSIDFTTGIPVYQQIEAQLLAQIESGELAPGDRLAPERVLAADLGVSRMTVRQAFDALARRGLVERGVGRGTFVTASKVDLDHSSRVAGFTEQMEAAGLEPSADVVHVETCVPPDDVAAALKLGAEALAVHVNRVRFGAGVPLTLEDFWLPAALFPGITELDLTGSVYTLMRERYGHAPVRTVEHLEPVAARAQDARALLVRPRSPLMLVERVAYDETGIAVEFARDRHRGDRARFVVEVAPRG